MRIDKKNPIHDEVERLPRHGITRESLMQKKFIDTKAGVTWEDRVLVLISDRLLIAKVSELLSRYILLQMMCESR